MARRRRRRKNTGSRMRIVILILVLLVLVFGITRCVGHSHKGSNLVVGYLTTWSYGCWENLNYNNLTHLNIAFVNPDKAGELKCNIPDATLDVIVKKAHNHNVKVEIALGGGGLYKGYTAMVSDKGAMKDFDKMVIAFLKAHDLDGVDVDVEGDVEPEFWEYYDRWIKDLEKRCHKNDFVLSTAVASWYDKKIESKTFDRFDYVSIMAYDNTNASNPSTYEYARDQLRYFNKSRKIPEEKLLLGIPFYGYRYKDGVCTGKSVSYREIATYNKDSEHVDASGTCRYNGIDTVKKKTRLGKEYGGVMVWALGQDATGRKSLLRAIGQEMAEGN